jgi:hypothetical protein
LPCSVYDAVDIFLNKILKVEKRVFRLVKDLLSKFDTSDGKYKNIRPNRRRLLSLDNTILKVLSQAKLDDEVSRYLKNFDQIERLNRLIYEGFLSANDIGILARMDFDLAKVDIIEQVTLGLTNKDILKANIANPIRSLIIQSIAAQRSIKDTEALLRSEIITQEGSKSRLLRYTRQISQDALSQYDGAINDGIRDELQLDGMFYLGSIIDTTRQFCYDLVKGAGRYEDIAIRPGVYRVEDTQLIIDRATRCVKHHTTGRKDCGSGWNENTTVDTFGYYRGGRGCRHMVSYFRLLEDDIPRGLRSL